MLLLQTNSTEDFIAAEIPKERKSVLVYQSLRLTPDTELRRSSSPGICQHPLLWEIMNIPDIEGS